MEIREHIKEKLHELDIHKKSTVVNGLLNKCANDLYDAYRHLEMACQYCDDQELANKLEALKMILGHEVEMSGEFDDGDNPTIIQRLRKILSDRSDFTI
jgi:hypothetical protein